ncbi:MAG TPA: EAL domain-containing protein [Burkholderiaceae bacterium]|nr:EAL domain-containing protein [Burkholderiaceae bacterium]
MTLSILGPLIEGLLEAVWIVDPVSLRILSVNSAAAQMLGMGAPALVGKPVIELTATPEDMFFWEDVAAGVADSIRSETLMLHADGRTVPVERRVSRAWTEAGKAVYAVGLRDRSEQQRVEDELEKLVAELRATLESMADGILVTDLAGAIRGYNNHFSRIWNLPEDLLVRRDDQALQARLADSVLDPVQYRARLAEFAGAPLVEATDVLVLRSGQLVERVTLPQCSRGQPIGRVYSFRDITQRVAAESSLRLAAKVFESSLDAIFIAGPDHRVVDVNPGCERETGLDRAALLQRPAQELFHDPNDERLFSHIEQRWATEGFWEGEVWLRRDDGTSRAVQLSWVVVRDDAGAMLQSIGFFKDLTEKLAAIQRIEQLAYSDALTGLPNRLQLSQKVDFALRLVDRDGGQFAVLFIDVDRFKNINDSLGHKFGDRVLIKVAERINGALRQVDTLCRLGGDEFVVYLHHADPLGAEMVARRILQDVAQPFKLDDLNLSISCSIGVAMYPTDGQTLDELIKQADTAMYRVKESGRANFRFYQPQMNADLLSRMKMDYSMRQAMERRQFTLHYQPQICLRTGRMTGAEALIRWTDPELGPVSPGVFIPLAEESGFIVTIGAWVLEEAVRQAALWQQGGTPIMVSVNVSALQFRQPDFVDRVADAIRMYALSPALLELELTESILVQDADEALGRLNALSALGVSLAIDDFGTGYSNLAYLKKFPLHKLKIDRSFLQGLPDDESDLAIITAVTSLGHALRLQVVAEGVETEAQREILTKLQCDQYQGFLCSPGLPAAEFARLLQAPEPQQFQRSLVALEA